MPGFSEEDISSRNDFEDLDFDFTISEDVLLEKLIETFKGKGYDDGFVKVLKAVRRAYNVKTTDLVGGQGAIGSRVTFVDQDGDPHRGIVLEPEVGSSLNQDEAYDPQKGEIVDPSEYPAGTIQLIYGDGGEFGSNDYFFDCVESDRTNRGLQSATSVTPARFPEDTYCYFAGWGYFEELRDE